MKSTIPLIVFTSSLVLADTEIADYHWKKRLLVLSEADAAMIENLSEEKAGLAERDLQVFVLSGVGIDKYPVKEKLAKEFQKGLSPELGKPTVWLIGKDGRTTLEWSAENFTFEKLFAAIDAMPMRQQEMEKGNDAVRFKIHSGFDS